MAEEIDITVKIHFDDAPDFYGGPQSTASVQYTNEAGQSITLEYNNEFGRDTIQQVTADLDTCLDDHQTWWSEKILQGDDLTAKIREAERQLKENRENAKRSQEWAERYAQHATHYERKIKELQGQIPQETNATNTTERDNRLLCPVVNDYGKRCTNETNAEYLLRAYLPAHKTSIETYTCKDCFEASLKRGMS